MSTPRASVVVVVHSGPQRLDDAVASLEGEAKSGVEVVVVDNGSAADVAQVARRRYPWAQVIRSDENLGFAGGVHLGAGVATGDVLIFLNDDAAAEDGFVDAHLEALHRYPDAAATAGRLVSWDGRRNDFLRGRITFDAHAFQIGQGTPVDDSGGPADGEPLPFACGGNMAVRRRDWIAGGGFDPELFAYFEDVELGWRLNAMGRQVVAAPTAVARHRGSATSNSLGDFRRGVLFERNALRVFFASADRPCREAFGTAVLMTFLHRLATFAGQDESLAWWLADPFGPHHVPPSRRERWRQRVRNRGVVGTLRHLVTRLVAGRRAGMPGLADGHFVMQLRAMSGFVAGLEATARRRASLDAVRRVPDRELVSQFPRLVVPTYAGDDLLFESAAFRDVLPDGWPVEFRRLDQVLAVDTAGSAP